MFRKGFPGGRERARLGSGLLGRRFCLWFYATSSAEGLCLQFTLALSLLLFFLGGGDQDKALARVSQLPETGPRVPEGGVTGS